MRRATLALIALLMISVSASWSASLEDVLSNVDNAKFADLQDQVKLPPKFKSISDTLPSFENFDGFFLTSSLGSKLAAFAKGDVTVLIDGHPFMFTADTDTSADKSQFLHELDYLLGAGLAYHVSFAYGNNNLKAKNLDSALSDVAGCTLFAYDGGGTNTNLGINLRADLNKDAKIDEADDKAKTAGSEYELKTNGVLAEVDISYLVSALALNNARNISALYGFNIKLEAASGASNIRVWADKDKTEEIKLPYTLKLSKEKAPTTVWVEGVTSGKAQLSIMLKDRCGSKESDDTGAIKASAAKVASVSTASSDDSDAGHIVGIDALNFSILSASTKSNGGNVSGQTTQVFHVHLTGNGPGVCDVSGSASADCGTVVSCTKSGSCPDFTFTIVWDTCGCTNDDHTLTFSASDGTIDERTVTVNNVKVLSVSGTSVVCINSNATFTATTDPSNGGSKVTWSGGEDPATGAGQTFTTKWTTPGVKTVTASASDCGGTSATYAVNVIGGDYTYNNDTVRYYCGSPVPSKYQAILVAAPNQPAGTTYTWNISGPGRIVSGQGTSQCALEGNGESQEHCDIHVTVTYTLNGNSCVSPDHTFTSLKPYFHGAPSYVDTATQYGTITIASYAITDQYYCPMSVNSSEYFSGSRVDDWPNNNWGNPVPGGSGDMEGSICTDTMGLNGTGAIPAGVAPNDAQAGVPVFHQTQRIQLGYGIGGSIGGCNGHTHTQQLYRGKGRHL